MKGSWELGNLEKEKKEAECKSGEEVRPQEISECVLFLGDFEKEGEKAKEGVRKRKN